MTATPKLSSTLSGVAGEYFVAAELSRRGYIASLTLRNTRGVDILASNSNATKSVGIQVKTAQGSARSWMLNKKVENDEATNLFFVLIRLNGLGEPEYYVVPKYVVAAFARANHERWLSTPGKKGQPHVDTPIRQFKDPEDTYLGKRELLCLDER
jgi:hypothetical protein